MPSQRSARHVTWVRSVLAAQVCQAVALAAVQSGMYAFMSPRVLAEPSTYVACIATGSVVLCLVSVVVGKSVVLRRPWNVAAGALWTAAWAVFLLGLSAYVGMHTFVIITLSLSMAIALVSVAVYILTVNQTTPPVQPQQQQQQQRRRAAIGTNGLTVVRVVAVGGRRTVQADGDNNNDDESGSGDDSDGDEDNPFLPPQVELQGIVTPFQVKVLFIVFGAVVVLCVTLFHADIHVSAQDTVVWVCVWSAAFACVFTDAWFMIRTPVRPEVHDDAITSSLLVHSHAMRVVAHCRNRRQL